MKRLSNSLQDTRNATNSEPWLFDKRDVLTIEEFADAVGKSPKTVRNMIARRQMPFVRLGNKHVLLRRSIGQWLEEMETKPCL